MSGETSARAIAVEVVQRGPLGQSDPPRGGEPQASTPAVVEIADPAHGRRVLLAFTLTDLGWELDAVEVRRGSVHEPLTAEEVRVLPLDGYVALAVDELDRCAAEAPLDRSGPDPPDRGLRSSSLSADDPEADVLATVARVYRAALSSPVPRERMAPTAAVARVFGVNRTQASRLVSRARRHAMLNPALPRRPGEAERTSTSSD